MTPDLEREMERFQEDVAAIRAQFEGRIVGRARTLDFMLKALFSRGHLLVEGLPGLGKTLMVRTLSDTLDLEFQRIQFTPDLMPADIVGTNMLIEDQRGHRSFHFQKGPVFGNVLLADEINRASPKTQSALLQAMEEREVSAFGSTYPLDEVFMTLATQNPIEMAGTYELPEAQLDRFMFKTNIPFPDERDLQEIARRNVGSQSGGSVPEPVLRRDRILEIRRFIDAIPVSDRIYALATKLVRATHPDTAEATARVRKFVQHGASPRGVNALLRAARVAAVTDGRFNLSAEDLEADIAPCLRHRLILSYEGRVERVDVDDLLGEVFQLTLRDMDRS